jgi:hypothetical protein
MGHSILLIACGALAKELVELGRLNGWTHLKIKCLPADLHNRPERIPQAVREKIEENLEQFEHIFVAYADCGTGGLLDQVLQEYSIDRLPGAHCYEFFAGASVFRNLAEEESGTFYLTDFLTRHFDRLVRQGLGLDDHPELLPVYFGNYRKLVYLAQTHSPELDEQARQHARYLGLEYRREHTGLGHVEKEIREHNVQWLN